MRHSYSSWSTFNKCPAKYKYSYILKLPRGVAGPALIRGNAVHDSIENYMLNKAPEIHKDILNKYGLFMQNLKADAVCTPEPMFLLNDKWEFVTEEKEAWVKGFLDLQVAWDDETDIYEWKTGRMYDEHSEQRMLYGLVGLLKFPEQENAVAKDMFPANPNFMCKYCDFTKDKGGPCQF